MSSFQLSLEFTYKSLLLTERFKTNFFSHFDKYLQNIIDLPSKLFFFNNIFPDLQSRKKNFKFAHTRTE